jgi:hypothetical protein
VWVVIALVSHPSLPARKWVSVELPTHTDPASENSGWKITHLEANIVCVCVCVCVFVHTVIKDHA